MPQPLESAAVAGFCLLRPGSVIGWRTMRLFAAFLLITTLFAGAEERYAAFADPSFPFFGLSVDASPQAQPRSNWVPRGVVVRVAEDLWALYDVDLVRLAAVWKGSFPEGATIAQLSYQNTKVKAAGGQKAVPRFEGSLLSFTVMLPGLWQGEEPATDPRDRGPDEKELGRGPAEFGKHGRWGGVHLDSRGVSVNYTFGGATIRERLVALGDGTGVLRMIEAENLSSAVKIRTSRSRSVTLSPAEPKHHQLIGAGRPVRAAPPAERRWAQEITTSSSDGARIPLPLENPWRRPVRPTGIAFFNDGRAVICTVDGDLWLVSGLDETLQTVKWQRFTSGLHEPYSVAVRDGEVFVFDRGGLKRIHDHNGDGEADEHEWFCHDFWQSAETRDFPHDMALRPDGGFYLVKGGQQNDHLSKHSGRVLQVSADGQKVKVFSNGHRNAFIGTDKKGALFGVDQQGHWVPSTPVQRFKAGGYYGFKPAAPADAAEPELRAPVVWVPHRAAQSAVDVIALEDGTLIGIDYFRPGLFKAYQEGVAARLGEAFDFPLLKGAIHPRDGHLYLVGFQIWGTNAKDLTGFGRFRSEDLKPDSLPLRVRAGKQGLVLHFPAKLDLAKALQLQRYHLQAWNYKRSAGYGSGYFRSDGSPGQEPLAIAGTHVSKDKRSLFIHAPKMLEMDQMQLGYQLFGDEEQEFYLSTGPLQELDLEALGFSAIDLIAEAASVALAGPTDVELTATTEMGEALSLRYGCIACHSTDGSTVGKSGPSWKGLAGSRREFIKAEARVADADYLREAILTPTKTVVKGYDPKDVGMPSYEGILKPVEIEALILFIQGLEAHE